MGFMDAIKALEQKTGRPLLQKNGSPVFLSPSNLRVNSGPTVSSSESSVNGKKKKRTSTILNLGTGEGSVNNKQAWKMGV